MTSGTMDIEPAFNAGAINKVNHHAASDAA